MPRFAPIQFQAIRFAACAVMALLPFTSGCFAIYTHYTVNVSVRDVETEAPIGNATVNLEYAYFATFNAPKPVSTTTDAQGLASLRAATFERQGWTANAAGYLTAPASPHPSARFPRDLDFRMYREPAPRIRIVVPNDYRGVLKLDFVKTQRWVQSTPGNRMFEFRPSRRGYIGIRATPLLSRVEPRIDVFREDGRPVPSAAGGHRDSDQICLRDLTTYHHPDRRMLLIIGTEEDAIAMDPLIHEYVNGDPHNLATNVEALDKLFAVH